MDDRCPITGFPIQRWLDCDSGREVDRPTMEAIRKWKVLPYYDAPQRCSLLYRELGPLGEQPYYYLGAQTSTDGLHGYSREGLETWLRGGSSIDPESGLDWGNGSGELRPIYTGPFHPNQEHVAFPRPTRIVEAPRRLPTAEANRTRNARSGMTMAEVRAIRRREAEMESGGRRPSDGMEWLSEVSPLAEGWSDLNVANLRMLITGDAMADGFIALARPPQELQPRQLAINAMRDWVRGLLLWRGFPFQERNGRFLTSCGPIMLHYQDGMVGFRCIRK